MKEKKTIESDLIWKKINGLLTKEEEILFTRWVEESEEHLHYYERACKYYRKGSELDTKPIDLQAEWQKLEGSLANPQEKRIYWRRAIAIAATISLIAVSVFIANLTAGKEETAINTPIIRPGESKATLTLDNGSSYELTDDTDLDIESKGARITSEGATVSYSTKSTTEAEAHAEIAYNTLETPRGGEFFVELADGTNIWINADSRLRYPVQFATSERRIELVGEAYFEVAPDASKPFIVTSGVQQIEVLGTAFNVTAYADDNTIVTTLVEGEVSVRRSYGEQTNTHLFANQQSILTKRTGEIISRDVDPNQFTAWKTGRFYFQDAYLLDIMKVLSRWYDVEVFFENTEKASLPFTGGFKRYESFEQVRLIIEGTEEVNLITNENTVIIK